MKNLKDIIIERLHITKDSNPDQAEDLHPYWFGMTKIGIQYPFNIGIKDGGKLIDVKVYSIQPYSKNMWKFSNKDNKTIFIVNQHAVNALFKSSRHIAILVLQDENLRKQISNPDSVVVKYNDEISKILTL